MNDADIAVGTTNFQDAANLGAEWAIAGYDVRHKLALLGVWEMPFFNDSTGLTRTLLGGWQLAGSAIFQTGNPINITRGGSFPTGDYNADGNGGDRPNAPASSVKTSGWSQEEFLAGIFKVSDFPAPAPGQNGNLVRNAYRGPGYADVSLSVSKKFADDGKGDHGVASRRVQRVQPSEPVGSGHGSEQLEFRKGDVAAEYAGHPARRSAAILRRRLAGTDVRGAPYRRRRRRSRRAAFVCHDATPSGWEGSTSKRVPILLPLRL